MLISELLLLAIAVSMDAFSVSVCKGMTVKNFKFKYSLIVALYFGIFQAVMVAIGYFTGSVFSAGIEKYDHWVVFALLSIMGIKMIYESFKEAEEGSCEDSFGVKNMLLAAFATSVDALAIGISLSFLSINIVTSSLIIGVITFAFCFVGVKVGSAFKKGFNFKAEIVGGVILILIGIKILIEHLYF